MLFKLSSDLLSVLSSKYDFLAVSRRSRRVYPSRALRWCLWMYGGRCYWYGEEGVFSKDSRAVSQGFDVFKLLVALVTQYWLVWFNCLLQRSKMYVDWCFFLWCFFPWWSEPGWLARASRARRPGLFLRSTEWCPARPFLLWFTLRKVDRVRKAGPPEGFYWVNRNKQLKEHCNKQPRHAVARIYNRNKQLDDLRLVRNNRTWLRYLTKQSCISCSKQSASPEVLYWSWWSYLFDKLAYPDKLEGGATLL